SLQRGWPECCVTGACTTCVCLALVLTLKSSVRTHREPKRYADRLALIQVETCSFTSADCRKRRTRRLCFARSGICSDTGRMNFTYLSSAMGPNGRNSGNCKCESIIFHGFATAPILAS